jgi:uncharacterized protein
MDRLASIDVLRGLALFGVMAINVVFAFRVSLFEQFLPSVGTLPPLDRVVQTVLRWAVDLKAFALFSFLFGVGLAIQFDRLPSNRRAVLLVRRLTILLAIGLAHLLLIWNGDILTEYAVAGFVVLPFLWTPRWFLAATSLLLLGVYVIVPPLVRLPDPVWMAGHVIQARQTYGSGGFLDVLKFGIGELGAIAPLHVAIFPRTLGLFLVGAAVWRTDLLQHAPRHRVLLFAMACVGLVVTIAVADNALAQITLALSYAALIIGLMTTRVGSGLFGWAKPLGRMALTNYLMQSLIFGWVFYGYGLGLFGKVGVASALTFGTFVYIGQAIFSAWWLKGHNFGPVEWLWRKLMYGVPQPNRRTTAA